MIGPEFGSGSRTGVSSAPLKPVGAIVAQLTPNLSGDLAPGLSPTEMHTLNQDSAWTLKAAA